MTATMVVVIVVVIGIGIGRIIGNNDLVMTMRTGGDNGGANLLPVSLPCSYICCESIVVGRLYGIGQRQFGGFIMMIVIGE